MKGDRKRQQDKYVGQTETYQNKIHFSEYAEILKSILQDIISQDVYSEVFDEHKSYLEDQLGKIKYLQLNKEDYKNLENYLLNLVLKIGSMFLNRLKKDDLDLKYGKSYELISKIRKELELNIKGEYEYSYYVTKGVFI